MPSLMSALGIDRLSTAERFQLVQELWDSIASEAEQMPLSESQKQELDRRLAALEANPERVVAWEEVEARIMARLGK